MRSRRQLANDVETALQRNRSLRKTIAEQYAVKLPDVSERVNIDVKEDLNTDSFEASYRKTASKWYNSRVHCKGCYKEFMSSRSARGRAQIEPAYYEHCIKQCEEYAKLGKFLLSYKIKK